MAFGSPGNVNQFGAGKGLYPHPYASPTRFWGLLTNMKENILIEIEHGDRAAKTVNIR